jgi:hypothetical protein
MKTIRKILLLILFVGLQPTINSQALSTTYTVDKLELLVYICKGPASKRYHETPNCQGLRSCSTKIYEVTISDAKNIGRTACGYCY